MHDLVQYIQSYLGSDPRFSFRLELVAQGGNLLIQTVSLPAKFGHGALRRSNSSLRFDLKGFRPGSRPKPANNAADYQSRSKQHPLIHRLDPFVASCQEAAASC